MRYQSLPIAHPEVRFAKYPIACNVYMVDAQTLSQPPACGQIDRSARQRQAIIAGSNAGTGDEAKMFLKPLPHIASNGRGPVIPGPHQARLRD
jgi:hypothetical protein